MKYVLFLSLIALALGAFIVMAQSSPASISEFNITISPRCFAQNISVDIVAQNHTAEGYTNYEARLNAGRCERFIKQTITETRLNNIIGAISLSINQTINNTGFDFYPDSYSSQRGVLRSSFTIT